MEILFPLKVKPLRRLQPWSTTSSLGRARSGTCPGSKEWGLKLGSYEIGAVPITKSWKSSLVFFTGSLRLEGSKGTFQILIEGSYTTTQAGSKLKIKAWSRFKQGHEARAQFHAACLALSSSSINLCQFKCQPYLRSSHERYLILKSGHCLFPPSDVKLMQYWRCIDDSIEVR